MRPLQVARHSKLRSLGLRVYLLDNLEQIETILSDIKKQDNLRLDRLVLLPGGLFAFIEVKRPGGIVRLLQVARHTKLRSLGLQVYLLDGLEQIETILNDIKKAR